MLFISLLRLGVCMCVHESVNVAQQLRRNPSIECKSIILFTVRFSQIFSSVCNQILILITNSFDILSIAAIKIIYLLFLDSYNIQGSARRWQPAILSLLITQGFDNDVVCRKSELATSV